MASLFRFAPCNECCKTGCCLHDDDFCRDDTGQSHEPGGGPGGGDPEDAEQGHLGPLWEVVSGTWFIDGGVCDGSADIVCDQCENGDPPCNVRIGLYGVKNLDEDEACEDATDLSGVHDLIYVGSCAWQKTLDDSICVVATIDLSLSGSILTATIGDATWTADVGSTPNCVQFNLTLDPDEPGTLFDATDSIVEVSVEIVDLECGGPVSPYIDSHLGGDADYEIIKCTEDYPGMTNAQDEYAAAQVTMTIEGVTGDGADAINDTFDLEFVKGDLWQGEVVGYVCGLGRSIDLTIEQQEDDYVWVARCGNASWTLNVGEAKPSAINFTDLVLTGENSCDECDVSESTCTISGGGWGVFYQVYGWSLIGTTWRAMVDYIDEDNYWCVEVKNGNWYSNPAVGAFRIIQVAEGIETIKKEIDPAPFHTYNYSNGTHNDHCVLRVSMRDNILSAQLTYLEQGDPYGHPTAMLWPRYAAISCVMDNPPTSRTIALGTGNWTHRGARFTNFCMLKGSSDCSEVYDMCDYCQDGLVPSCFNVTFENMTATDYPLIGCLERTFNISAMEFQTVGGLGEAQLRPCDDRLRDTCTVYYPLSDPHIELFYENDEYILRVYFGVFYGWPANTSSPVWEKNYGSTKPDCCNLDGEIIPQIETGDYGISGDCVVSANHAVDCESDITDYLQGCCATNYEDVADEVTVTVGGLAGVSTYDFWNGRSFALPRIDEGCSAVWRASLDKPENIFSAYLEFAVSLNGELTGLLAFTPNFGTSGWLIFGAANPNQCECDEWSSVVLTCTHAFSGGWELFPNPYSGATLTVST